MLTNEKKNWKTMMKVIIGDGDNDNKGVIKECSI